MERRGSSRFVARGRSKVSASPAEAGAGLLEPDAARSDADLEIACHTAAEAGRNASPPVAAMTKKAAADAVDLALLPNLDEEFEYDVFLSHLQRNAQNTIIAMN
eukprot:5091542-Prymnesium_polylepis.1